MDSEGERKRKRSTAEEEDGRHLEECENGRESIDRGPTGEICVKRRRPSEGSPASVDGDIEREWRGQSYRDTSASGHARVQYGNIVVSGKSLSAEQSQAQTTMPRTHESQATTMQEEH